MTLTVPRYAKNILNFYVPGKGYKAMDFCQRSRWNGALEPNYKKNIT